MFSCTAFLLWCIGVFFAIKENKSRMKFTTNTHQTSIDCDGCGKTLQVNYFETTVQEKQTVIWCGTPPEWLSLVNENGYIDYACSEKCAIELTERNKQFWTNWQAKIIT